MTMDKAKRKRLQAKGWQVGSAADFLGLSGEEQAYIDLKLSLAEAVATRRKQMRVSQAALAKKLHSSQSRVAKMEAADASVSLDLLVRSFLSMGATRRDLMRAIKPRPKRRTAYGPERREGEKLHEAEWRRTLPSHSPFDSPQRKT
jgi:transcriptional regulator with XRE-family HTH domain